MASECNGDMIPQYRLKKITKNNRAFSSTDATNRVYLDDQFSQYEYWEEIDAICSKCRRKECVRGDEFL